MSEKIAQTRVLNADKAAVEEAAALLRAGGLVAFPTETVYGLGADASNGEASARIYEAKGRPSFNPLIAHFASSEEAFAEGQFGKEARALARAFWPGPLTLVVPAASRGRVCDLARAGLDSVALRVPEAQFARDFIAACGVPVAAPSANRSGHVSPTSAAHVLEDLSGRIDLVLDGGTCKVGVESTIVSCLGGRVHLLRPGGVTRAQIAQVLGRALDRADASGARPVAPGQLVSHYAPRARVRLNAVTPEAGEVFLDFGARHAGADYDLSPRGDLREAAARLFGALRLLDGRGAAAIAVAPIPQEGLGEAINERLERAAAGR